MDSIKTILACVDFSKYSDGALRLAAFMAESFKAKLLVLNVVHRRDVDALKFIQSTTSMVNMEEVVQKRIDEAQAEIDKFLQEAQCGQIDYEKKVRLGTPWEEIIKETEEAKADMVVIGAKGKSDLEHTLFGSNADKLYRHCPVTVVSARGKNHRDMVCKLRGY